MYPMPSLLQSPLQRINSDSLLRGFGLAILFGSLELIIFSPAIVLAQVYISGTLPWLTCLHFLFSYVIGCFLGRIKWLNRRLYELTLSMGAGYTLSWLLQGNNWHSWVCAAIGSVFVYRGIRCFRHGWLSLFPASVFVIAGLVYFVGVPIMGQMILFQPYVSWMNGFGLCSLIIFFFVTNRSQLLSATLAGNERTAASALSNTVKRSSRIWLTTLIAFIAVIAYFQQMRQAIISFLHASIAWLLRLMQSDSTPAVPQEPIAPAPPMLPPTAPVSEPSWFDMLLHYAQIIIGYLIVIALILYAIYVFISKLIPKLVSLIRRLMNRSLNSRQGEGAEGFTDEKETLLALKDLPLMWWQKALKRWSSEKINELKWSQLPNNQERVRFLYRVLIQQAAIVGYTYKKNLTPNETEQDLTNKDQLPSQAVHIITSAYNEVRYGDEQVSDERLNQLLHTFDDPSIRKHLK